VLCLGVLIVSAITLSTINDIILFDDPLEGSEYADDAARYRGMAWWLLFVGIAGLITQVIISVTHGLYHGKIIKTHFVTFAIAVSCNAFYIMADT